jgi:hypothetical protein
MRRSFIGTLLIAATAVPLAISGSLLNGHAQVAGPQPSEFNYPGLVAPFAAQCAQFASQPCPDAQSATTWSVDNGGNGALQIWTQFGSLLGTAAASSNNARNLILQPYNPSVDFTATTSLTFPATANNVQALGQTAGLIAYVNDDNFIFVGRVFNTGQPQLEFVQELNGVDAVTVVPETQTLLNNTVYLQLTKLDDEYTAAYSYDNVTFTPISAGAFPATATATPTGTATVTATATATAVPAYYTMLPGTTTPKIGLFAFGGTNTAVSNNQIPANFDWFRLGAGTLSQTPGPVVTATSTALPTSTVIPTSTAIPTTVATVAPTATVLPTATAVPTATATTAPVPTPTPITIVRRVFRYQPGFRYVSIWYHYVRKGTFEHLEVQANRHTKFGIWVHVFFPSGVSYAYFQNTDANGHWRMSFAVPTNSGSPYSKQAVVTLQLWHGKQTVEHFAFFTVL